MRRRGRPQTPIVLSPEEVSQLQAITGSRSLPHGLVARAKIILMAVVGLQRKTRANDFPCF